MRLHSEKLNVEKGGVILESEFNIKATAKAFNILSSGLYSDKILAIVRELSCNAWDAHVAAKNTKTAFEIKLPNTLDPTFYVKDFGTGLSHEEVLGLYTTYFDSSKSDSNDYIGALGLGSKSPFSYVPTFSVESRYKGEKRMYSAFIGENGVPSIALMGKEKTKEPNGMTISLAMKTGDSEKFRQAAKRALMYFKNPTPKVIGGGNNFKAYELKHTVTGTNWKVRETDYYANMEGAYVIQGFVAYPIDRDILRQNGLSKLAQRITELDIDFSVPIGDVEVAASREALSYTKPTIRNLINAIEIAAKEMRHSIQKEFDACKTAWEAKMLYCKLENDDKAEELFNELHRAQPFTYNGKAVKDELVLDLSKIKNTQVGVSYMSSYKNKPSRSGSWDPSQGRQKMEIGLHNGMTVLVDDVYGSTGILGQYLEANRIKGDSTYVIVLKGTSKNAYDQAEIDAILKMMDNPPHKLVSDLPYTKVKQKYTYRARKADQCLKWTGYPKNGGYGRDKLRRVYSRLCWTNTKADPTDPNTERFYVELERFSIQHNGRAFDCFDIFLEHCQTMGILPQKVEIIGLNEKQAVRAKTNAKAWHNVFKYAVDKFAEMNKNGLLTNAVIADGVMSHIGNGIARHVVMNWPTLRSKVVDGAFKKSLDNISTVYEAAKGNKVSIGTINSLSNYTDPNFSKAVKTQFTALTDEFAEMLSKHSMLRLVNWEKVGAKDVDMILDYANFVAKK